MQLTKRVRNILLQPKLEWNIIAAETATPRTLLFSYVLPLALIPALVIFIDFGLIGFSLLATRVRDIPWALNLALQTFLVNIAGYYIMLYAFELLAPTFNSAKNIGKSAQLAGYSFTAVWVASLFQLIPPLSFLSILGLYSIYLLYLGIPVLKHTPGDKSIAYLVVALLVSVVGYVAMTYLIGSIFGLLSGNPYGIYNPYWHY